MDKGTIILLVTGVATMVLFAGFSTMVKDTVVIWYQTRLFGLLSYAFLLVTVVFGEIRVLAIKKSDFPIFKYHRHLAVFSLYLVIAHFISAFADNFKWGRQLTWVDYLGFSFSDKWLALLSFGVLAFYLMIITAATSATKAIQGLGYNTWKAIHLLSYAAFFIAYVHSVNLGTDVKTSVLAPVISQLMRLSFILVVSLLMTRVLKGLNIISDQMEVNLAVIFFIALILSATALAANYVRGQERIMSQEYDLKVQKEDTSLLETENRVLQAEVKELINRISEVRYGQGS
jgi:DMSO/TMAO reductase YedYZ heme-binding membrane subunit